MSDENKKRSVEEIHQEYSRICAQAGHLQYQIVCLETDLKTLNEQLKSLNLEAASLQAKEAEVKPAE